MYKLSKIDGICRLEQLLQCTPASKFPIATLHLFCARLYSMKFWTKISGIKTRKTNTFHTKLRRGTLLQSTWDAYKSKTGYSHKNTNKVTYSNPNTYSLKFRHRNLLHGAASSEAFITKLTTPTTVIDGTLSDGVKEAKELEEFQLYFFPSTHEAETYTSNRLVNKEIGNMSEPLQNILQIAPPKTDENSHEIKPLEALKELSEILMGDKLKPVPDSGQHMIDNVIQKPLAISEQSPHLSKNVAMLDMEVKAGEQWPQADAHTTEEAEQIQSLNEKAQENGTKAWEVNEFLNNISEWRKNEPNVNAQYFMNEKNRLDRCVSHCGLDNLSEDFKAINMRADRYKFREKREVEKGDDGASEVTKKENAGSKGIALDTGSEGYEWENLFVQAYERAETRGNQGLSSEHNIPTIFRKLDKNWSMRPNNSTGTQKGRSFATNSSDNGTGSDKEQRARAVSRLLDDISDMKSPKPLRIEISKTDISKALEDNYSKVYRPTEEIVIPPEIEEVLSAAHNRKHIFFQFEANASDKSLDSIFSERNKEANEICNALNTLTENFKKKRTEERFWTTSAQSEAAAAAATANVPGVLTKAEDTSASKQAVTNEPLEPEIHSTIRDIALKSAEKAEKLADHWERYNDDILPVQLLEPAFKDKISSHGEGKDVNVENGISSSSRLGHQKPASEPQSQAVAGSILSNPGEAQLASLNLNGVEALPGSGLESYANAGSLRSTEPQIVPGQDDTTKPSGASNDTERSSLLGLQKSQNEPNAEITTVQSETELVASEEVVTGGVPHKLNLIQNVTKHDVDLATSGDVENVATPTEAEISEGVTINAECNQIDGPTTIVNDPLSHIDSKYVILYSEDADDSSKAKPLAIIGPDFVMPYPNESNSASYMPSNENGEPKHNSDLASLPSPTEELVTDDLEDSPHSDQYEVNKHLSQIGSKFMIIYSEAAENESKPVAIIGPDFFMPYPQETNSVPNEPSSGQLESSSGKGESKINWLSKREVASLSSTAEETVKKISEVSSFGDEPQTSIKSVTKAGGSKDEIMPEPVRKINRNSDFYNDALEDSSFGDEPQTSINSVTKARGSKDEITPEPVRKINRNSDIYNDAFEDSSFGGEPKTSINSVAKARGSKDEITPEPVEKINHNSDIYNDATKFTYEDRKGISELKIHFKTDEDELVPQILHDALKDNVVNNEGKGSNVEISNRLKKGEKLRGKMSRLVNDDGSSNDSICLPGAEINEAFEDVGKNTETNHKNRQNENKISLPRTREKPSGSENSGQRERIEHMEEDDIIRILHEVLDKVMPKTGMLLNNNSNTTSKDGSSKPEEPKEKEPVSDAVLIIPETEVGPGASKKSKYKNPEYYSYNKDSFYQAEAELKKYRLKQPSSKKNGSDPNDKS